MATKRQRRVQERRPSITPAVVELWQRVRAGEARYLRCIRAPDAECDSPTKGQHCAPCADYLEASLELDRALGVTPWEDVEDDVDLVQALDEALNERGH